MKYEIIYKWAYNNLASPNYQYKSEIPIVSDLIHDIELIDLTKYVITNQKQAYQELKKIKNKYFKIIDQLYLIAEDAWERVKSYAKEELFDQNEDKWDDVDEVSDYDIDHYFDENYFIDYFQQELNHNVKGKYKIWDKYMSDINFDKWNNNYQGLEDYIKSQYLDDYKNKINYVIKANTKDIQSMINEFNLNKHTMIKLALDELDQYDADWKVR